MSINVLDVIFGPERRLTPQDDMESLLYVVLYCALIWQPHNLPYDTLALIIRRMFDERVYISPGPAYGGLAKRDNAHRRAYTRVVQFESRALHEWLNTMMDYHSPLPHHGEEFRNRWFDPAFIETFWADFLAAHSDLEPANRIENDADDVDQDRTSPGPSRRPSQPTTRPRRSRKRGREPSKSPPLKSTRSSPRRPKASSAPPRVRRSERIQDIQRKKARLDGSVGSSKASKGSGPGPRGRSRRQVRSRK